MKIQDIQIPEEIAEQYHFLMMDFQAMLLDGKGKSSTAMNAYYNNYMKTHKDIRDIAAFAMALNHTGYMLEGEDQTLYWNLQVKATQEVYLTSRFSEDEQLAFRRYLD